MTDPTATDRLRDGIAYALVRADLPSKTETAGDYADRLAPLMIESGYLAAPAPDLIEAVEALHPDPLVHRSVTWYLGWEASHEAVLALLRSTSRETGWRRHLFPSDGGQAEVDRVTGRPMAAEDTPTSREAGPGLRVVGYRDADPVVIPDEATSREAGLDAERLARAMHLARRLPEMAEPYCDNPLTDADLANHIDWAEAIIHAFALLPPYARLAVSPVTEE